MDLDEIKETETWQLYTKGVNYLRQHNVYSDTDVNYRMYNGNQWEGVILDGVEPVQYNFIETIVNYKVSTINSNLWAMNFSSENFENRDLLKEADKVCKMLNKKAANVWEKDQMDYKIRQVSDDAAINDEGLMYVYFDESTQSPVNEILNKNDVQYGNEQSSDIQNQPYIIIAQRKPITNAVEMARKNGVSEDKLKYIVGDIDTLESSGIDSKLEKDDMCTVITKMYKEDGKVWYQMATKYVELTKPKNTKLTLYPIAHFVWKEKKRMV